MGIESLIPIGVSAIGGLLGSKGSKQAGTTTSTQQQQIDPRMQQILYGADGSSGLLGQIVAQASKGQSPGLAGLGAGIDSYLGGWGTDNFMRSQQAAQKLQETTNGAPQVANTQGVGVHLIKGADIDAPSQNALDLRGAFDRTINGNAGDNPYLKQMIQGGIDQSTNAFGRMQADATRNLNENILPGIRSGAVIAGGYGGSRQGIAEGRAIGDTSRAIQDSITNFGQGNTNAAVGAQANAFNQGQDRSLSALLNLSGQQYGVASQEAAMRQQAELANQNAFQNAETTNTTLRNSNNQMNVQSALQTQAQNNQAQAAGIGLSSGLLDQAYKYGMGNSNADLARLSQVGGTVAPFTGLGATSTSTNPYFNNSAGGALGGALGGMSLYNMFKKPSAAGPGSFVNAFGLEY